ncbi:MAG: EamA family transporter [Phycisphaerales bacterium]|nr:EamA family transporter [Phycisphaerales bacterium]
MFYLLLTSLLWGFSFGLIGHYLADLDPTFVALVRMALSLLVFLPFLRRVPGRLGWGLLLVGAVEFGLMYLFYIRSFQYLATYKIVLCTIFTPLFVTLLHDLQSRRFHRLFLLTALLAIIGAAIPLYDHGQNALTARELLTGFLLIQLSNLCFAFGQLRYQRLMAAHPQLRDHHVFAYLYIGAVIVAGLAMLLFPPMHPIALQLSPTHLGVLLYLGVLPSGVGFFLWNLGVRRVNAGLLAILNNAKIPIGILASLMLFHEPVALLPLLIGSSFLAIALFLNERKKPVARSQKPGV